MTSIPRRTVGRTNLRGVGPPARRRQGWAGTEAGRQGWSVATPVEANKRAGGEPRATPSRGVRPGRRRFAHRP